MIRTLNRVRH